MTSKRISYHERLSRLLFQRHSMRSLMSLGVSLVALLVSGYGQTFSVIHTFTLGDGHYPMANVVFDSHGSLYGTTQNGGGGVGSLYTIDGHGSERVLHFFRYREGQYTQSAPLIDPSGNIYGTNSQGGLHNEGTVFEYTGAPRVKSLWQWGSINNTSEGSGPEAGLVRDGTGNFLGTTYGGGTSNSGVIYQIDRETGAYSVLYNFSLSDGCCSTGAVLIGQDGSLYSALSGSGVFGFGSILKFDPVTGVATTLHSFTDGSDGGFPAGTLVEDSAGSLYGTTSTGGPYQGGTIFTFDLAANVLTTLYSFGTIADDGGLPYAGVTMDKAGNLYGTTYAGGGYQYFGTVFELTIEGVYKVLHRFSLSTDGGFPYAGVTLHGGALYEATRQGGDPSCNCGVVYKIQP